MIRKLLIYLCAFVLVLSAAAGSVAEITPASEEMQGMDTVIYYVPATRDTKVMSTAKVIARAISSFRQAQGTVMGGKYNSGNALTQKLNDDALSKLFGAGNNDGTSGLKCKPDEYAAKPYEYWFIVPTDVFDAVTGNADLMNDCREILAHEQSRAHFVFIGSVRVVPQDSALAQLEAEGKADWIFTMQDFRTETVASAADASLNLHTGTYLLASLAGQPVDLALTRSEDGTAWTYSLPEASRVLVLASWNEKGKEAGTVEVRDAGGNLCNTAVSFSAAERNFAVVSGTMVTRMEGGDYTISVASGTATAVRAYWYPNLGDLAPALVAEDPENETIWGRGVNTIILSLGKTIGRPDQFTVQFIYRDNEDVQTATTLHADYDETRNAWTKQVNVGTETKHVYIEPVASMAMDDGNRIWEWSGGQLVRDVKAKGVTALSNAPGELTVYTDRAEGLAASVDYSWSEFFNYASDDNPSFSIEIAEEDAVENPGITFEVLESGEGFRVTAVNGEELADSQALTLVGSVKAEEEGQEAQTASRKVVVTRRDVSTLYSGIVFASEPKDEVVKAGGTVAISASVPEETLRAWQEACSQLPSFPAPDTLRLVCALEGTGYGEEFAFDAETMQIGTMLEIPVKTAEGQVKVNAAVRTEGSEADLVSEALAVSVRNNVPTPVSAFRSPVKVTLKGFPWAYEELDLLEACFGTNIPFTLFTDDEDNLTELTLEIENTDGLELPEGGEAGEDGTSWSIRITDPDNVIPIRVVHSNILEILKHHTIRMTVSDGVNTTEPYEVSFQVFSEIMTIASYVIAGLVLLLVLLLIILIIRQALKPSFESISVRCFASSDEDQDSVAEIMNKSNPIPMFNYKKKPVTLTTLLILSRQPALGKEYAGVTKDITILPAKHNGLTILFGKDAQKAIGRHEKKENVALGHSFRMRIGSEYILIENVLPGA